MYIEKLINISEFKKKTEIHRNDKIQKEIEKNKVEVKGKMLVEMSDSKRHTQKSRSRLNSAMQSNMEQEPGDYFRRVRSTEIQTRDNKPMVNPRDESEDLTKPRNRFMC